MEARIGAIAGAGARPIVIGGDHSISLPILRALAKRHGPLALVQLDQLALGTANEIPDKMYRQGRDRLHAPSTIPKQMVTAGLLGLKTGKGFYSYEGADSPVVVPDDRTPSADD